MSRLVGPSQSPSKEDGEDGGLWRATDRVYGSNTIVNDLEPDSLYSFRVRSCRNSMFSPYSPEVAFHTPPAPGKRKIIRTRGRRKVQDVDVFQAFILNFFWCI